MANFNKVFLMGNLTRDPEMKYTQSGQAVVSFGMAMNRKYRNRNNEMIEETTFVDIEGWGKQAETFNQYMRKGRPAFIEGRLKLDTWENREGQKRSKLRVVMENFQFIGGAAGRDDSRAPVHSSPRGMERGPQPSGGENSGSGDGASTGASTGGSGSGGGDYDFDDIPF